MTVNKTQEGDKTIFALDGRLDTTTSPKLQEALIPAIDEAQGVTLDFAGLSYISSAGLRVLLMGQKAANSKNISMTIRNVSEEIMEVFDMTGFTEMLSIDS